MSSQAQQVQPRVHTVVHFEIPATDPAVISKFYGQLFGWQFDKADLPGIDYWVIHQGNPQETMGGVFKRTDKNEGYRNYVLVKDIDASIKKAKELGAKELLEKGEVPGMGFIAILSDPDNNVFGLWQPFEQG